MCHGQIRVTHSAVVHVVADGHLTQIVIQTQLCALREDARNLADVSLRRLTYE